METKEQILKDYKSAKSFKSEYENGWLEAYRQYLSASEPRYFPDGQTKRSSVFVSPFNIFIDPAATCIENARYVIHETEIKVSELRANSEGEEPLFKPEVVADVLADLGECRDFDLVRILEYRTDEKVCVMTCSDGEEAQSNIDEMHAYRGSSQSEYKEAKKVGQHLLREDENPFLHGRKPFIGDSYTRLPNQVYGIGVVEPNQRLQETLNTMVNMIIDNWNQGINRRYVYSRDADIDLNDLNNFNVPGGLVGVYGDATKAVNPLPSFTPAPGDYGILDLIKSMIALSSGMDDFYARGQGSARSNRTAAGTRPTSYGK